MGEIIFYDTIHTYMYFKDIYFRLHSQEKNPIKTSKMSYEF